MADSAKQNDLPGLQDLGHEEDILSAPPVGEPEQQGSEVTLCSCDSGVVPESSVVADVPDDSHVDRGLVVEIGPTDGELSEDLIVPDAEITNAKHMDMDGEGQDEEEEDATKDGPNAAAAEAAAVLVVEQTRDQNCPDTDLNTQSKLPDEIPSDGDTDLNVCVAEGISGAEDWQAEVGNLQSDAVPELTTSTEEEMQEISLASSTENSSCAPSETESIPSSANASPCKISVARTTHPGTDTPSVNELEQVHGDIQAAISRTSAFLDSDPPSKASSESELQSPPSEEMTYPPCDSKDLGSNSYLAPCVPTDRVGSELADAVGDITKQVPADSAAEQSTASRPSPRDGETTEHSMTGSSLHKDNSHGQSKAEDCDQRSGERPDSCSALHSSNQESSPEKNDTGGVPEQHELIATSGPHPQDGEKQTQESASAEQGSSARHEASQAESRVATRPADLSDQGNDECDELLHELESALQVTDSTETMSIEAPNGVRHKISLSDIPEYKELRHRHEAVMQHQESLKAEILSLQVTNEKQGSQLKICILQRDSYLDKLQQLENKDQDEIYMAQIKERVVQKAPPPQPLPPPPPSEIPPRVPASVPAMAGPWAIRHRFVPQPSRPTPPQARESGILESLNTLPDPPTKPELEKTMSQEQRELQLTRDKLAAHDAAAKRAIVTLQNEVKAQVEKVTKMYEECRKEKDSMVMRYAQAEQKNIELQDRMVKMDRLMKENTREKDMAISRFKAAKGEKMKLQELFESKAGEVVQLRRQIENLKEMLQTQEMKTKWAQNKLKTELDAHKESKMRMEDAQKKLKVAREENDQVRRECQSMVKSVQDSEGVKALDHRLREKEAALQLQRQENNDQEEVHQIVRRELDHLKNQTKDLLAELNTYKDKVRALDTERISQEESLTAYKGTLQGQKDTIRDLKDRLEKLVDIDQQMQKMQSTASEVESRNQELEQSNCDVMADMDECSRRESEHLEFTQKISDKNARLLSENTSLSAKLHSITAEHDRLSASCAVMERRIHTMEGELTEVKRLRIQEGETLAKKLTDKSKAVEELSKLLEEEKDENRTLRRRHSASIKDLTRQLHQSKRRLDAQEHNRPAGGDTVSMGSMGSRTSSNGSLDTAGVNSTNMSRASSQEPASPQDDCPPIVEVVEVDRQMLVEKIVRLQKAHARKNEKMEFMEDHIRQMIEQVQKKTRLIQHYIMREEAGTLSSESSDNNKLNQMKEEKVEVMRKGGIMASLYSSHSQDGHMSLDLSLEINSKLQAVLEDILLKNITLKENIETLGEEIARLSQENRRLQLSIQRATVKS